MFTTLKNKFPTAHIEVPQWGKNSENYAYIRKEGAKYNKDANGHYKYTDSKGKVHEGINYSDTFEESGILPPDSKQGDRNDLRTLYALIASGADNAQILGEHPEYLRDISHIDRTRQTILEEKYRNVFRQMTVTYIFGPTGTGKTRSVKEGCGYSNCYAVSDYHHPFDGYRGQKVMLFDEFHSSLPLNSMLQYLDGYPWNYPVGMLTSRLATRKHTSFPTCRWRSSMFPSSTKSRRLGTRSCGASTAFGFLTSTAVTRTIRFTSIFTLAPHRHLSK